MLRSRYKRACSELEQISRIVGDAHRMREAGVPYGIESEFRLFGEIDHPYWRAFDYCATLVRLYATYERFVLDIVEQWIEWCLANAPEVILKNSSFQAKYESGFAEILRRKDDPRFEGLDRGSLLSGLNHFYAQSLTPNPVLPAAPLFATLPNLRLSHVVELFATVGMGGLTTWLKDSSDIQTVCIEEGFGIDTEIRQIVERRNEAAHGNELPHEIWGANELISRIRLIATFCDSVFRFVLSEICKVELKYPNSAVLLGNVNHIWTRIGAAELISTGSEVVTGQQVIFLGRGRCYWTIVESIQIEGNSINSVICSQGTALGIKIAPLPDVGMQMVASNEVREFAKLIAE